MFVGYRFSRGGEGLKKALGIVSKLIQQWCKKDREIATPLELNFGSSKKKPLSQGRNHGRTVVRSVETASQKRRRRSAPVINL